jgi:hypothetical protein
MITATIVYKQRMRHLSSVSGWCTKSVLHLKLHGRDLGREILFLAVIEPAFLYCDLGLDADRGDNDMKGVAGCRSIRGIYSMVLQGCPGTRLRPPKGQK